MIALVISIMGVNEHIKVIAYYCLQHGYIALVLMLGVIIKV